MMHREKKSKNSRDNFTSPDSKLKSSLMAWHCKLNVLRQKPNCMWIPMFPFKFNLGFFLSLHSPAHWKAIINSKSLNPWLVAIWDTRQAFLEIIPAAVISDVQENADYRAHSAFWLYCAICTDRHTPYCNNLHSTLHPNNLPWCHPLPNSSIYETELAEWSEVQFCVCMENMWGVGGYVCHLVEESEGLVHIHLDNIQDTRQMRYYLGPTDWSRDESILDL